MKRTGVTTRCWLAILAMSALIWVMPAGAQSQTAMPQDRDSDLTRQQLAAFDQFLDNHPELSEQLRNNPSLVNSKEFVENHPALASYLQQHPEVREDLSQNPNAVMHQEQRFDRREDQAGDRDRDRDNDVTRRELANMDNFLDSHPEIAEQLRKNPSLVKNKEFVESHPALQQFLQQHGGVAEQMTENPNAFMHQEERFDRREDQSGDRDVNRTELANMDRFLDSHPEIAEQFRKDPSLVDNKQFVQNHPALQQFLASHPGVREEITENPNGFMHREQRFDRHEDSSFGHDRDVTGGELSSFHEFLEGNGTIARELSNNPSLAKNQEYLENHAALQTYLQSHPEVREELNEHPDSFLKSAQSFDATSSAAVKGTAKLPASQPKMK